MQVSRDKIAHYDLPPEYYFATRNGNTEQARNYFFEIHPELLVAGTHCAVGNDEIGWELELFNGTNWIVVNPSPNYLLTITNDGLAALNSIAIGGIKLVVSGVKFISEVVVPNPAVPIINWTDTDLFTAGNGKFVFTCGTVGSVHQDLNSILSWRFNSSSGSLQYILTLPPTGTGSMDDAGNESYKIGTIGLYIKDPNNNTDDILFAVGRLTSQVTKYCTTVDMIGNTIKFYLNTTLSNLGYVSNLAVLPTEEQNIPEVPNESFLENPLDANQYMFNCYVIDNLNGTGMPALAVPRMNLDHTAVTSPTWTYFQPSNNFTQIDPNMFDSNVYNYMFVCWDPNKENPKILDDEGNPTHGMYILAEGSTEEDPFIVNNKMPCGVRVGNSIVFSGDVFNDTTGYSYELVLGENGKNYQPGDELVVLPPNVDDMVFRINVEKISPTGGAITKFKLLGPTAGDVAVVAGQTGTAEITNVKAHYSPYSQLPHNGTGATFTIRQIYLNKTAWDFGYQMNTASPDGNGAINKKGIPVYCGSADGDPTEPDPAKRHNDAGMPVFYKTDAMLGWVSGINSINLALDLRNEASEDHFGTVRYATDSQVRNVADPINYEIIDQRTATIEELNRNYLQITKPTYNAQAGYSLDNPIEINTFTHFNEVVLGKGVTKPYDSTSVNPMVTDQSISFYGLAFSAWYQDIAELYESDRHYDEGTLVCIGQGPKEMTIAIDEVNGIISSKPGVILGKQSDKLQLPVALVGRTPVLFDGKCLLKFGSKIYLSKVVPGMASTIPNGPCLGKIIEKDFGSRRKVECIVRLTF